MENGPEGVCPKSYWGIWDDEERNTASAKDICSVLFGKLWSCSFRGSGADLRSLINEDGVDIDCSIIYYMILSKIWNKEAGY